MESHFLSRTELLTVIDCLNLKTKKKLSALFMGDNESRLKGSGIQFSDFRPYEWGDDIRHISWSTTAKTGKVILKSYEEEKELNLYLLIDISGSSLFGSSKRRKIDMYCEVSFVLGMAALKHGFRVGLVLFDREVKKTLPLTRRKEDFLRSLQPVSELDLLEHQSDLQPALTFLDKDLKQRSLLVILSDFLMAPFRNELLKLSRKHDIILLRGYDDAEQAIAARGIVEICDPESGDFFLFDTESPQSRKALHHFYASFSNQLETIANDCQADLLPLSVQDDYLQRLVVYFDHR